MPHRALTGAVAVLATAPVAMTAPLATESSPYAHGLTPSSAGNGLLLAVAIGIGCAIAALAALAVLVRRGRASRRWHSPGMVALVLIVGTLAGGATYLVNSDEHNAVPGVPFTTQLSLDGEQVGVMIAPHRPGVNLVHVSRKGVLIGLDPARLRSTEPRKGAGQGWATVRLRQDTESLWLSRGGQTVEIPISPGDTAHADAGYAGPNGPECLSLMHGALLADSAPPKRCPGTWLDAADAAALRTTIRFISDRGHDVITLVGDGSPRSAAAENVVRTASARHAIRVCTGRTRRDRCSAGPDPTVIVAGWETASATVNDLATGELSSYGTYLAPWLLTPELLTPPAGQVIPLRYPAMGRSASRYLAATRVDGLALPPSAGGYLAWRENRDDQANAAIRMYASASVSQPFEHHAHYSSWLPGGSVVPISGPLEQQPSR